jgi:GT2 family glycosyltransferase
MKEGGKQEGVVGQLAVSTPLDIVVPIYRNAAMTRECLVSIVENMDEIAELRPRLVLINDSPDDTEVGRLLDELWLAEAHVTILKNETNQGFVRAVNRGLLLSRKDRRDVLLVNSDTQTFPGTLSNLMSAVRADPQIAFASPRSNNAALCSLPHHFGGSVVDPSTSLERWRMLSASMPAWHFTPTAVGFYMYIRHDVLIDHGLLAEEFGKGYEEENDLVMRAGKVGKRAIIVNKAFAYHAGSASFKLSDVDDLDRHKQSNNDLIAQRHPEFLPLVRRYERSAQFRSERLLAGLLPDDHGRLRVAFDLTGLGEHHNGTNEHTVAVLKAFAGQWRHKYSLVGVASAESFRFHRLDRIDGLRRADPAAPGLHAVAIRIGQPFSADQIVQLESLAPACVYAMLDTIAEDCGPISVKNDVAPLWDHVAAHASGIIYNSRFSETTFRARHSVADHVVTRTQLLSTDVCEYMELDDPTNEARSHVLVLGNHFPHKGTRRALEVMRQAFPQLDFVAIADETRQDGNVSIFRSGAIDRSQMRLLFRSASVIVLPSHMEGFGMGLMHALANRKPLVARRIPPTLEVLESFADVQGVELFNTDADLVSALSRALGVRESRVGGGTPIRWADWAKGLVTLIDSVVSDRGLFARLKTRIQASDALRALVESSADGPTAPSDAGPIVPEPLPIETLLALDDDRFLEAAYTTLLRRFPDASGLITYRQQLGRPGQRLAILQSLAKSPEGRLKTASALLAQLDLVCEKDDGMSIPSASEATLSAQVPASAPTAGFGALQTLEGVPFVAAAYRFVLGREPDEAGLRTYMRELGSGGTRLDVLYALYESIEARALAKNIPELEALKLERVSYSRTSKWRALFAR